MQNFSLIIFYYFTTSQNIVHDYERISLWEFFLYVINVHIALISNIKANSDYSINRSTNRILPKLIFYATFVFISIFREILSICFKI